MGAPIPRAIVREARRKLPGLTVLGGWGQSENALVTLGIPGDPEEKLVERDGYPWPGMEIRVVDPAGAVLPAGAEGRLQVRGPFLFVGYAERLEMTRESFDGDWFDTGDVAVIDEDGYLSITGRTKDVIIRGGENIPVAYVENVLYEHPDVAAVAVVGVPDPRLQERACACVVLRARAQSSARPAQGVPRHQGRGQAVLAGEPAGAARAAPHGQRQDPEIPAPRSRGRATVTAVPPDLAHPHRAVGRRRSQRGRAIVPVRTKRSCQPSASSSRCGVCRP